MKDERLEKEFEEYFKGVNTPDNITGDAKKYVKPKSRKLPKFVKFASVAASFVLVFAVALTVMLKSDFGNAPPDNSTGNMGADNPPSTPDNSGSAAEEFTFYTDGDLKTETANAYSVSSLNSSLKFIENLALAENASVGTCEAGYKNGSLAIVKTEVSVISGLNRDETEIYVEFTDKNLIYEELYEYYKGSRGYYYGAEYYLTEKTGENGEPEFMLHVLYKGVKYYFNVSSSDRKAYEKYLNLIVK